MPPKTEPLQKSKGSLSPSAALDVCFSYQQELKSCKTCPSFTTDISGYQTFPQTYQNPQPLRFDLIEERHNGFLDNMGVLVPLQNFLNLCVPVLSPPCCVDPQLQGQTMCALLGTELIFSVSPSVIYGSGI